jgi:hypothetical protein
MVGAGSGVAVGVGLQAASKIISHREHRVKKMFSLCPLWLKNPKFVFIAFRLDAKTRLGVETGPCLVNVAYGAVDVSTVAGFLAEINFIILVPQDEQTPCNAFLPFLSVTSLASFIGLDAFSLTQ